MFWRGRRERRENLCSLSPPTLFPAEIIRRLWKEGNRRFLLTKCRNFDC
ncbi:unnamed protein product [Musa acuminata var. zebrina]